MAQRWGEAGRRTTPKVCCGAAAVATGWRLAGERHNSCQRGAERCWNLTDIVSVIIAILIHSAAGGREKVDISGLSFCWTPFPFFHPFGFQGDSYAYFIHLLPCGVIGQ